MQGKQAKIVSPIQERAILGYLMTTRYPARDRVMFLLSMKAGLRAKEMASLTWAMVTDAQGQVAEVLHVPNRASKGKTGGRTIPLHPDLQDALVTLQTVRGDMATPDRPIEPTRPASLSRMPGESTMPNHSMIRTPNRRPNSSHRSGGQPADSTTRAWWSRSPGPGGCLSRIEIIPPRLLNSTAS